MEKKFVTVFKDFLFIIKAPGAPGCKIIKKDLILSHSNDFDYYETFEEFNNSLFCSSTDTDFEEIVKLYKGPITFDCIAIDRVDVTYRSFDWLIEELLEELNKRYPEVEFYDLFFV